MRLRLLAVALVALVAAGAASAKTSVTQQTGRATATPLDFACSLDKNGSLRWITNLAECRKKETGVTILPGPIHVCVQADGSSRKVASQAACVAPGTYVKLPPLNVAEYFCADNDGRLRHVSGTGLCTGSETEVFVAPTNHAPTDIGLSPQTVAENVPVGTVVGDLTSTDPDGGDTHTYTFTGGNPDNAAFQIDNSVTPRKLKTNAAIDFEAKSSYSIMIRTTDSGGLTFDEAFTINIIDVNEPPIADNETFNGASSAVGNSTFVGNDPDDAAPATPDPTDTSPGADRPQKTISADILQGDTDPEGTTPTVVPGTVSSTDAPGTNNVTLEADGDFTFEPKPGTSCTDHQDSFTYTITDGTLTGTGTVTIDIAGCAWYVNNNDAQGNSGTAEKPFDTLAQAETSSATGDSIYVYRGDGTATGHSAGIDLKANQKLIGEAATLIVGSDTLQTADATKRPLLADLNANVVNLAAGNEVRGVQLDPQGTGGGISGGAGDAGGTIDDVRIVDTGVAGLSPGLELNGTSGTFNVTNLTVDNSTATAPASTSIGVKLNSAGTVNFTSAGTIAITTNGAKALDATSTSMGTGSVFDDITVTASSTGGVNLTSTTGTTQLGDGSGTDLNLTTTSGSAAALNVNNGGTVSVPGGGTANISATGGPAVDVTSTSGATFDLDDVDSTNSATDGINIDGLGAGTFSAQTGDLAGATGIAFDLNGGSGAITYPGTFGNGTGATAEVTGRTGGAVSFAGAINDTNDSGGGITVGGAGALGNTGGSTTFSNGTKTLNTGAGDAVLMSNSDGHTLNLTNGGLDIDTTTGKGLEATTSGTLTVTGSGNSINSSSATALRVTNTDIGDNDLTFQRIDSGNATAAADPTNGIVLDTTANVNGRFFIQASGGTCTSVANCTGGAIQNTTQSGVIFNSVPGGAELLRVAVADSADHGIDADNVAGGILLDRSAILSNGNATADNGLDYQNVTGVTAIRSSDIIGSGVNNDGGWDARIQSTSGTLNLTVNDTDFNLASTEDGLQVNAGGTATIRTNITGNRFDDNKGDAFQVAGDVVAGPSTIVDHTFTGNTIDGKTGTSTDGGVVYSPDGSSRANISSNTITNPSVSALILNPFGTTAATTTDITASSNTIGNGTANSGSEDGDGIQLKSPSDGTSKVLITNNNVRNYGQKGIWLRASESTNGATTHVTATSNQISLPDTGTWETGIYLQAGSSSLDVINMCADVGGAGALANTFTPIAPSAGTFADFTLDLRFVNSILRLPGYTGTTVANRQSYFFGRNTGFATFAQDGSQNPQNTSPPGSACLQPASPTLPTAPPALAP